MKIIILILNHILNSFKKYIFNKNSNIITINETVLKVEKKVL